MEEKSQAEWIYEVLGKKKGAFGASIRELTDADEKKIREEMLRYWKELIMKALNFLSMERYFVVAVEVIILRLTVLIMVFIPTAVKWGRLQ